MSSSIQSDVELLVGVSDRGTGDCDLVPPSCITANRLRHLDRRLKHLLQRDGEPQILPRNPRPHHLLTSILGFGELDRRKWRMRMSRNSNDVSGSIAYWRNVARCWEVIASW